MGCSRSRFPPKWTAKSEDLEGQRAFYGVQMDGFRKLRDDLEKVIEKEDSASSITTDSDDTSKEELNTFRQKITYVLHTNRFQILVICLVILDSLLVIGELLFDLRIVELPDHENHIAPHILHYLSLTILGIFLIEIAAKIYALRLTYFHHKLELFDAVVVIVSFTLDIVFRNNEGPEAGAGLLIILRLWRVTRIINAKILKFGVQATPAFNGKLKSRPVSQSGRPVSGFVRPGSQSGRPGTMEQAIRTPRTAHTARPVTSASGRFVRLGTDKPVVIPEKPGDKAPRAPPEFIRNVWGSSAGAGSGDFHVYRGVRRREYARQKFITEKSEKDEKDVEYHKKVEANKRAAEERVAKNRAKRLKKKQKMKAKKMKNGKVKQEDKKQEKSGSESDSSEESGGES